MNINVRLGVEKDIDSLEQLYDNLNEYLEATTNYPGWKKHVYPTREEAIAGVSESCLYVAEQQGVIVGSMILRQKQEPAFSTVDWQEEVADENVLVIYTFVTNPKYLRCGIGKTMLEFASQYTKRIHIRSLRLDVYEKNLPAIKLYETCGFQYVSTVSLGLESIGLDRFLLYEKLI